MSEKIYLKAGLLSHFSNGRARDIRIKLFSMKLNGRDCGDREEMISFLRRGPRGVLRPFKAFGRNLWPFSFSESGRLSSSSALPWKGIYRGETVGT